MGSFNWGAIEWRKWLIGAGLAASGAVATYGLTVIVPDLSAIHPVWGATIGAAAASAFNAIKVWVQDNSASR